MYVQLILKIYYVLACSTSRKMKNLQSVGVKAKTLWSLQVLEADLLDDSLHALISIKRS